jgi:trimethylguanosine synthase
LALNFHDFPFDASESFKFEIYPRARNRVWAIFARNVETEMGANRQQHAPMKTKPKKKRKQKQKNFVTKIVNEEGEVELYELKNLPLQRLPDHMKKFPELERYWAQRYRLFSKFDDGVQLDRG